MERMNVILVASVLFTLLIRNPSRTQTKDRKSFPVGATASAPLHKFIVNEQDSWQRASLYFQGRGFSTKFATMNTWKALLTRSNGSLRTGYSSFNKIATDQDRQIIQLYSFGHFSFPVINQPEGQLKYISPDPGKITRFQLADDYGSIGLMAHNYLAGKYFFDLTAAERLTIVYDDLYFRTYQVVSIRKFQVLHPSNPASPMLDLESGKRYSAGEVFYEIYGHDDRLVLQTCIEKNWSEAWGRLFIIAEPVPYWYAV